jgi:hypothetical protein
MIEVEMPCNITYDVSVNLAPATFKSAVGSVAQFFQNLFSDPVTINITAGYGEVGGQSMPSGALGSNISFLNSYSYAQIKSAFAADSKTGDDGTAVGTLPATSPAPGGGTYWVPRAEAKALGLIGASGNLDGNVGFSNTVADDLTAGDFTADDFTADDCTGDNFTGDNLAGRADPRCRRRAELAAPLQRTVLRLTFTHA